MSQTLYTIEFDQGDNLYYYVGITTNYEKRMEQHVQGSGATWIKRNFTEDTRRNAKPQVIGTYTQNVKWEETKKTLELMVIHGINNVRGAEYCKPTPYTESDVQEKAYAVIHHLNREDLHHIMIGLRKNIAEENLGFADSSAAEPTAVGSETSTRPGFHDSTYITRNSLDTPPDDVEMLRKTMEGAKLSDSNDVLL